VKDVRVLHSFEDETARHLAGIAADFDAALLAQGMKIAPAPARRQPFTQTPMPRFMLHTPPSVDRLSAD
jgi:hypothetical protein